MDFKLVILYKFDINLCKFYIKQNEKFNSNLKPLSQG